MFPTGSELIPILLSGLTMGFAVRFIIAPRGEGISVLSSIMLGLFGCLSGSCLTRFFINPNETFYSIVAFLLSLVITSVFISQHIRFNRMLAEVKKIA